nr:nucleoside 2-deoxyribosyltransferase [Propionicimonas sp.]
MSTVFIAGPFKALVDAESEPRYRELRTTIEELIDFFNSISWNVLNAHTREQWGAAFLQPNEYTRLDYDQITSADLVVALPGDPPSPGTHIEIGWASATGIPLIILLEEHEEYSGMIHGLPTVGRVAIVGFSGSVEEKSLHSAMAELLLADPRGV